MTSGNGKPEIEQLKRTVCPSMHLLSRNLDNHKRVIMLTWGRVVVDWGKQFGSRRNRLVFFMLLSFDTLNYKVLIEYNIT